MTYEKDAVGVVVEGLSVLIATELRALSSEHWEPRFASGQMVAELKFRRERITRLRTLRAEFENIMFGLEKEDA